MKLSGKIGTHVSYMDGERQVLFEDGDSMPECKAPDSFFPVGGDEGELDVETAIKISYGWGREGRVMFASGAYNRAFVARNSCSCCRFHVKDGAGSEKGCAVGEKCPVHTVL